MILYSLTLNISPGLHHQWLAWMKESYIPELISTGFFSGHKFFRLLREEEDGITFSFQGYLNSMEEFRHFEKDHEAYFISLLYQKFPDQVLHFRTLLEEL